MTDREPRPTSRRALLKTIGGAVGAAALPLGAGRAQSGAPGAGSASEYDVVVVGGGFAGVTAARELAHAGLRTVILEARNRLGGRTFAARVGDEILELGGTWIHHTQPHVFAEVSRYGLEIVETPGAVPERVFWLSGGSAREAGLREVLPLVKAALCASGEAPPGTPLATLEASALMLDSMSDFHQGAAAAFPRPFDPFFGDAWKAADGLSVKDRLDQMGVSGDRRVLLEGMLGASCCGALAECGFVEMLRWWALSGNDFQRYNDTVARYKLRAGTSALIDAMIADGAPEVRLATPVTQIAQDGGRVEITTERGQVLTARAAVVTLPMNVLANVAFSPALDPAKLAASKERHAGCGVKLYARVRGQVPSFAAFAPESEPLSMLFTSEITADGGVLIAFGTRPAAIDAHDVAAVQKAVARFLPDLEVVETFAYDWHLDPYSLGTWCILRPGQMTKYLAKLREPQGSVYFASGDSALGCRGFIDGAIESGNRVARQVVAELGGAGRDAAASSGARAPASAAVQVSAADPALQPCAVCHPNDESGRFGLGPNLHGVVGRPAASDPAFAYSQALRDRHVTWTERELDAFLADPAAYVPGTKMPFPGIADPAERARVVRALREQR